MKIGTKLKEHLKILLVEDNDDFRKEVRTLLGVYNDIDEATTLATARTILKRSRFDLVLLDKHLPDGNGLDLIPEIKGLASNTVVIVLTADDQELNSVQKCLEAGASDYLYKTENIVPDLLVRIPMALSRALLEKESKQLAERLRESFRFEIIGRSTAAADLRKTVQSLKGSLTPVLITGETGTGKELIARRLHSVEEKPTRPFIAVNCGAIPENLVESELFGHVRGAFSGALQDQVGKFAQAHDGDLFLDEIGELPLSTQIKLLRVLQVGEITPLGSKETTRVSVRVIAATNRSLEQLIQDGKFREDLYFRLSTFKLRVPSLPERPGDILPLVARLLARHAAEGQAYRVSATAQALLLAYAWPGNVRELENVVLRAMVLCADHLITPEHLMFDGVSTLSMAAARAESSAACQSMPTPEALVQTIETDLSSLFPQGEDHDSALVESGLQAHVKSSEQRLIHAALQATESRNAAAKKLGISPRTLRYKLAKFRSHSQGLAVTP